MSVAAAAATAGGSAAAAAAAAAPVAGTVRSGGTAVGFTDEQVGDRLHELQEYSAGCSRECLEIRRERADLGGRLAHLEQELYAEEQLGHDLQRRIETLEAALVQERRQHDHLLQGGSGSASEPLTAHQKRPGSSQETSQDVLAVYLDRLPKVRQQSCREMLKSRLRQAGVELYGSAPNGQLCEQLLTGLAAAEDAAGRGGAFPTAQRKSTDGVDVLHAKPPPAGYPAPCAENATGSSGVPSAAEAGKAEGMPVPMWRRRWTLRSHLDGARCVVCDEQAGVLVSCGEDALVKAWDLAPLWKGSPLSDEMEPYVTLRGHTAAVLCVAYRSQDRVLFSAGMDYSIRAWRLPDSRSYNAYSADLSSQQATLRAGLLVGHRDNVWTVQLHPHLPSLLSSSADGSIGIWTAELDPASRDGDVMEASFTVRPPGGDDPQYVDVPTCAAWVPSDVTKFLGGYTSSRVAVFDAKRGAQILDLFPQQGVPRPASVAAAGTSDVPPALRPSPEDAARPWVTSVNCHQILQVAATGHTDHTARIVDLVSGQFVTTLADHGDAVTSVCIDPVNGHSLVTGCHDGYVRSFDLRNGRCMQYLNLHEHKYDEAVHCVHHGPRLLATAGADGNVIVLAPFD
eukprot:gnl/TRDRNA2_/TRDRNA2_196204_c0_seq1.p1 gnl/TRDRNA2_/TRDRNA2_196204_c0~~gnl/TRDRNA2_/TRDRNA2_196204_c0_seq1.p1  ORF type:complete len:625 (+),score=118.27 gnl/TRDRNA2_/TRDRNA2_196204_c0_seq1:53-1927(+)